MQIYHDSDVDTNLLMGKKIAVLGYGAQGRAQALCLHDSGLDVTVGARKDGASWNKVKEDGLKVATIEEATKGADVVMVLLPDEVQPDVYRDQIAPNLKKGAALEFAHGFAITFKLIAPPADCDVIMMAPKGPGDMVRVMFLEGFGVPSLVCVHQDNSGKAKQIALALAKGIGATRAGVFETTFDNETKTDLINMGGFEHMWHVVSNTAEYGGLTRRDRVITEESKKGMRSILDDIESGKFKDDWRGDWNAGLKDLKAMEEKEKELQLEVVGKEIRSLFERKNKQ